MQKHMGGPNPINLFMTTKLAKEKKFLKAKIRKNNPKAKEFGKKKRPPNRVTQTKNFKFSPK